MLAKHAHSTHAPRRLPGAWLSLFAMLMIFIGPLISQSMPMEHHTGMSMSSSMSGAMDMSSPMTMTADDHAGHHTVNGDKGGIDHVIWAKCGYCTLLFSCPALTQTLAVTAPVPPKPADFYRALPQNGHAQRSVFPNARSRAPPSRSVV
ncbi:MULTISPECIES: DUF2946 domain-containing protein [unclassified Pseudomonas]|uniref:DUF2946 domain-containing protein n=1 Tax=unclassified Pseudomonas TaxID=196821 RepID=UPI000D3337C9|nr:MULTISPECIES: DUF2946 domain-containing protein [unclassified Pseudomonas]RAU43159.1 DUF2946 domain-containing protein [Pseudomonas sp. RIT 409]RAU53449.1 DUF2946 domain-containing protein [Pseudomonas sp. RIT 412]